MAGCGSKKMAKGGMVKMSPRKALAMGKKPSGAETKVKKFAVGGLATVTPQQFQQNQAARVTAAFKARQAATQKALQQGQARQLLRQKQQPAPQPAPQLAPTASTGLKAVSSPAKQLQDGQQARVNAAAQARQAATQKAIRQGQGRQLLRQGPQTIVGRKFAKGGAVKKK